jgi:hypothetical protein
MPANRRDIFEKMPENADFEGIKRMISTIY